ncbi:MAG: cyanophycin synthetase [Candidatus Daviesbacteria bacterium]|nr:cyanophycin synthetase [Candidatus Daviesbacteria bacterium]
MKHVHFLGIGGSGASAVAAIAQANEFTITGCDIDPFNNFTKDFNSDQLFKGHSADHLVNIDILVVTPAVFSLDPDNLEVNVARKNGIPVLSWQEFMGKYLLKGKFVIAVSGTHGKSTTTAMIGGILEDAGLDPTVEVGAIVPRWNSNFRVGKSKYFLTEADEFNNNFLFTRPNISVVTSIEMDHPEFFKDFGEYQMSFEKFLGFTKETIVANISDIGVAEVLKGVVKQTGIKVLDYSKSEFNLNLKVSGHHNQLNAAAAFQVGLELGIDPGVIKSSLENYQGIERRMEYLGEFSGAKIYTDFGHHPTEVKATIAAAREMFPNKKLMVIFQPHMFSRTKALFLDFVTVLKNLPVERVLIMDIYPSREIDRGLIHSRQLVEAIKKDSVSYVGSKEEVLKILKNEFRGDDVIFFIGAGDIDKLARGLVKIP